MQQQIQTLKGFLRPARRNTSVPDWHRESSWGWNPKYPTFLTVSIRRATLEFPARAVFIQLNNAAGSCYCRLDSPATLRAIASHLSALAEEAETAWEGLAHTEQEAQAGIAAFCAAAGIQYDPNDANLPRQIRQLRKGMEQWSGQQNGSPTTDTTTPADNATSASSPPSLETSSFGANDTETPSL